MTAKKFAVCPACGQTVAVVAVTVATGRNQSAGRARLLDAHDDPIWPGALCPGAYTSPK